MRIGQNPAKSMNEVAKPERITVAVLNYIPFISGFYAQMPQVLKICLESVRQSADLPFDLLVFDNGSCQEVRQFLVNEHQEGRIQYLVLSEKNLGKGGAWNVILAGAPGEIVAYTDNDCYFYPGWMSRSLQLLETFPNVGMVTARPFHTREEFYNNTLNWARSTSDAVLEKGKCIPWEVYRDFDLSLGQDEAEIRQRFDQTEYWKTSYLGVSAIVGASHYQFMARKDTLAQFLPFDMDRPMGQVRNLDFKVNEAGLLRLMLTDALMMNMSNTPLVNFTGQPIQKKTTKRPRLFDFPPLKKVLLALYDRIFDVYYKHS